MLASVALAVLLSLLSQSHQVEGIRCSVGKFYPGGSGQCDTGVCKQIRFSSSRYPFGTFCDRFLRTLELNEAQCNSRDYCNIEEFGDYNKYSLGQNDKKIKCVNGRFTELSSDCPAEFCHSYLSDDEDDRDSDTQWYKVGCGDCPPGVNNCSTCDTEDNCHVKRETEKYEMTSVIQPSSAAAAPSESSPSSAAAAAAAPSESSPSSAAAAAAPSESSPSSIVSALFRVTRRRFELTEKRLKNLEAALKSILQSVKDETNATLASIS